MNILLVDGNDRDGTYRISTEPTTLANHTRVNANPIFRDQRFDKSIHGGVTSTTTLELLPQNTLDQPTTIANWYLYRTNQGTAFGTPTVVQPLYYTSNGEILTYSSGDWDTILENLLFYSANSRTDYRIRYEVQGVSGTDASSITGTASTPAARGDAMTDTTLNSEVRINDQDNDNYRSQRFPTGGSETETTYRLKIYRI